jgi:hypothetical protein
MKPPNQEIDGRGIRTSGGSHTSGCLIGAVHMYFNRLKFAKVAATKIAIMPNRCCPTVVRTALITDMFCLQSGEKVILSDLVSDSHQTLASSDPAALASPNNKSPMLQAD